MISRPTTDTIGVLASGGLDSSILIGHLLRQRRRVQPFYIRTGLHWQAGELPALTQFLAAVATADWRALVVLELPLADLYDGHWSMTGRDIPGADSPDEAVFLPGRNALLDRQGGRLVPAARGRRAGAGRAGHQPLRRRQRGILPRLSGGDQPRRRAAGASCCGPSAN